VTISVPHARAIDVAYADFSGDIARLRGDGGEEDAGVDPEQLQRLQAERACTERPDFYEA